MSSGFSRRQTLKIISFLSAGTAAVGSVPFISKLFADPANAQSSTVHIRENIATFMQSPQKIEALRRGVRVMQSRSATDPTSWIYQANIHGTTTQPLRTAWNTCDHRSFFFFPWHRMYLYYFERILRQASGDSTLTLPYWNYSDFPNQRSLPEPFRIPANSTNPLYVSQRASSINQGAALASAEVSYEAAFRRINFFQTTTNGQSFGGQRVAQSTHRGPGQGLLEGQPHNQIHVVVGGSNGWMRQVELAARDPIFWLHHANIDRLWERWLQLGDGRANPITDSDWMNDPFTFFDENRTRVQIRGRDIIDTVQQLNYRYDDSSLTREVQLRRDRDEDERLAQTTVANPLATTSVDNQETLVELKEARLTVNLFKQSQGYRLSDDQFLKKGFLMLNVKGVEYNPRNSIPYQIYINLPEGVAPEPNSCYYVGRLALFALPQRATFRIDITDAVRELQRLDLITGNSISVTFVPPPEEIAALQLQRKSGSSPGVPVVRFRKVTITAE